MKRGVDVLLKCCHCGKTRQDNYRWRLPLASGGSFRGEFRCGKCGFENEFWIEVYAQVKTKREGVT